MKNKFYPLAALTVASLTLSHSDAYGVLALDVTGGLTSGLVVGGTSVGYSFTVNSNVFVESLLFYDYLGDGFNGGTVNVSIFPDTGSVIPVSGITASFDGSSSNYFTGDTPTSGAWLEVDISDTPLAAGDYTIIAKGEIIELNADRVIYNATTIAGTPEITYGEARSQLGTGNPVGNHFVASNAFFGPNFTYSPIPEVSSFALIAGLSAVGFLASRRRPNR